MEVLYDFAYPRNYSLDINRTIEKIYLKEDWTFWMQPQKSKFYSTFVAIH